MYNENISEYGCLCDIETAKRSVEEIIGSVRQIREKLGEKILLTRYSKTIEFTDLNG